MFLSTGLALFPNKIDESQWSSIYTGQKCLSVILTVRTEQLISTTDLTYFHFYKYT